MISYTIEEKLTLVKEYLTSGCMQSEFCRSHNIPKATFNKWLHNFGFPTTETINNVMSKNGIPSREEELQAELAKLLKEKRELEKRLAHEKMKVKVCETLIDLAESTYHIRVRKNSDAK